ncbi:MAG: phosphoribosylformylglycinamidine synthase, partial [Oscillibacter sp.]|nr:phosphoribosylformylglycinamidine synthase [Oscillibacter sp.]
MVFRVFVEKKKGLAPEAASLLGDIRSFLGLTALEDVRILNRYDVEDIEESLFRYAKTTVFSEPQLDIVSDEAEVEGAAAVFAVEPLPGQFDQRADSVAQCIQLLGQCERPTVRSAKVYALYGALSAEDVAAIKKHVINPVESREASLDRCDTLKMEYAQPETVETITGFIGLDAEGLSALLDRLGLAMDLDDLTFLQGYFRDTEQRDPTITEIRVVDTYWSDHCRHTTFSTIIDEADIQDEAVKAAYERYLAARIEVYGAEKAAARPQTLMDAATIGAKVLKKRGLAPEIDESEEINACSIHVPAVVDGKEQDWLLMFKNETHNHPTEIEPFGGAATCIGGCIRDPLSGRVYVHQAMRFTGGGDPRKALSETLPGKLPQRKLAQTAAAGYSSYGNQIGLATGHVAEVYHEGYIAKRLECGAVVGAAPAENVVRERPAAGDVVILLGGRTGRDGIGGATGSSKSHNLKSLVTMASEVQRGNAPEERKIQRLFRDGNVTRLIKRCNDFGA